MVVIYTPAYAAGAQQNCWQCESSNEVVTLASTAIGVDEKAIERAEPGEAFLLSYISEMPAEVFRYVTSLAPNYRKLYSRTAEHEYYANVCKCGANFGDWFLFNESDGAWFPKDSWLTSRIGRLVRSLASQAGVWIRRGGGLGSGLANS